MGRIIGFDQNWKSGTPESVIHLLEKALERARNGDIAAVFVAAVSNDRTLDWSHAGDNRWSDLIAAIEAGKFDMLMEAERG